MSRRYLIVDDSPVIRMGLERNLQQMRVPAESITSVGTAEEALEHFEKHGAEVVFVDLTLPGMSGDEAALRMFEIDPHTRLVVVTAADRGAPEVRRLLSMGAFAVLEKPVRFDDLRALFAELEREESGAGRIR